jgi:hypothetical protein
MDRARSSFAREQDDHCPKARMHQSKDMDPVKAFPGHPFALVQIMVSEIWRANSYFLNTFSAGDYCLREELT